MVNHAALFRPATAADFPAICALVKDPAELFLVHPRGRFPWTVEQVEQLARAREALTVAELDGNVVAFANLYERSATQVFVGNVIVHRNHRREGVGRALVTRLLETARSIPGMAEVRISVFAGNNPALLLYAGFGFQPYAMEERVDPKGQRVALIHLRLPLVPG